MGTFTIAGRSLTMHNCFRKLTKFTKAKLTAILWPDNSVSWMVLKGIECACLPKTCIRMFIATLFIFTKKNPSTLEWINCGIFTQSNTTQKKMNYCYSDNTWIYLTGKCGMWWATHEENIPSDSIFMKLRTGKANGNTDQNSGYLWRSVE